MKVKVFLVLCMSLMMLSACSNNPPNNDMISNDLDNVISASEKLEIDDVQKENVEMNEIIKNDKSNSNTKRNENEKSSNAKISSSQTTSKKSSDNYSDVIKEEPKEDKAVIDEKPALEETPVINTSIIEEKPCEPSKPTPPSVACPNGKDPSVACDVILDTNYYFMTFTSEEEAISQGEYYLDEVVYLNDLEITNYSTQAVYRNDHSIAYYGLNFWSNGTLIQ